MKINLDDGYNFGLGIFETIHLYKNKAIFLKEHLDRLNFSLEQLNIKVEKISEEEILKYLEENSSSLENQVLKIMVSEKNIIFSKRDYTYTNSHYERAFKCNFASIKRNESSIFTFHKTLNYAENIYEKRKSMRLGFDEPIFLNSKGCITEGATTNIFFVKNNKIFTPKVECGLLNGIIRQWLIKDFVVEEKDIYIDEFENFDEVFLTNSLLGIMPVKNIEKFEFSSKKLSKELLEIYRTSILEK